jgi:hypothetical protein
MVEISSNRLAIKSKFLNAKGRWDVSRIIKMLFFENDLTTLVLNNIAFTIYQITSLIHFSSLFIEILAIKIGISNNHIALLVSRQVSCNTGFIKYS